jgi:hypothetical protein
MLGERSHQIDYLRQNQAALSPRARRISLRISFPRRGCLNARRFLDRAPKTRNGCTPWRNQKRTRPSTEGCRAKHTPPIAQAQGGFSCGLSFGQDAPIQALRYGGVSHLGCPGSGRDRRKGLFPSCQNQPSKEHRLAAPDKGLVQQLVRARMVFSPSPILQANRVITFKSFQVAPIKVSDSC